MGKLITVNVFVLCFGFWAHAENEKHDGGCKQKVESMKEKRKKAESLK